MRRTRQMGGLALVAALAVTLTLAGCGGDGDSSDEGPMGDGAGGQAGPPAEGETATWSSEVRAVVERNCTVCHQEGGSAPFAFETYEAVVAAAPAMLDAMNAGRMPPWPADPECRTFENERTLSAEDLAVFTEWVERGAPEGEPMAPIAIPRVDFEPTVTATALQPYVPDLSTAGDDYRCFLLDLDFEAPTWVVGSNVLPDTAAVHHVLVYSLTPGQVAAAEALDAADETEGYTCFGGPLPSAPGDMMNTEGSNLVTQIAAWVPGSEPNLRAEGVGLPVAPGSRLVMQMHYSAAGGVAEPDQTLLQLKLTETPPAEEARTVPLAIQALDIPAGESTVTVSTTFTNWSDQAVSIQAFTGHMHLLGTSISATLIKKEGGEQCGVSIPEWDFDWQLSYRLPEEAPLVVEPGDAIRLTCSYDNSAANQPVVDGVQQTPRDVTWGDGSLDEMCLMYAAQLTPYAGPPAAEGAACAAASDCYAGSDGSLSALMACEATNADCAMCTLRSGLTGCGLTRCVVPLAGERACVTDCILSTNAFGGSLDRCLRSTCGEAYQAFLDCADPVVQAGDCEAPLQTACSLGASEAP